MLHSKCSRGTSCAAQTCLSSITASASSTARVRPSARRALSASGGYLGVTCLYNAAAPLEVEWSLHDTLISQRSVTDREWRPDQGNQLLRAPADRIEHLDDNETIRLHVEDKDQSGYELKTSEGEQPLRDLARGAGHPRGATTPPTP